MSVNLHRKKRGVSGFIIDDQFGSIKKNRCLLELCTQQSWTRIPDTLSHMYQQTEYLQPGSKPKWPSMQPLGCPHFNPVTEWDYSSSTVPLDLDLACKKTKEWIVHYINNFLSLRIFFPRRWTKQNLLFTFSMFLVDWMCNSSRFPKMAGEALGFIGRWLVNFTHSSGNRRKSAAVGLMNKKLHLQSSYYIESKP
jgi:hypothetical protein